MNQEQEETMYAELVVCGGNQKWNQGAQSLKCKHQTHAHIIFRSNKDPLKTYILAGEIYSQPFVFLLLFEAYTRGLGCVHKIAKYWLDCCENACFQQLSQHITDSEKETVWNRATIIGQVDASGI